MNKAKFQQVSIEEFRIAIKDKLIDDEFHKGEWLRWLEGYNGPGPFNRQTDKERSARFVYNRLAYPEMLLWLVEAAGVEKQLVQAAQADSNKVDSKNAKYAAIRKHVPWEVLERSLWKPT